MDTQNTQSTLFRIYRSHVVGDTSCYLGRMVCRTPEEALQSAINRWGKKGGIHVYSTAREVAS